MKIRQITYSGTYGLVYSDTRHDPPAEPDMEADWTLVSAVWQQVDNGYGGHVWRWVWIWEGARAMQPFTGLRVVDGVVTMHQVVMSLGAEVES